MEATVTNLQKEQVTHDEPRGLFLLTSAVTMDPNKATSLKGHSPARLECFDQINGRVLRSFQSALAACRFFGVKAPKSSTESALTEALELAIWPLSWRRRVFSDLSVVQEEVYPFDTVRGEGGISSCIYAGDETPKKDNQCTANLILSFPWNPLSEYDANVYNAIKTGMDRHAKETTARPQEPPPGINSSSTADDSSHHAMHILRHTTGVEDLDQLAFIWTEQTRDALLLGLCSAGFLNWEGISHCSGLHLISSHGISADRTIVKPTRLLVISLIAFLVQCDSDDNLSGVIRGKQRSISSELLAQLLSRSSLCRYLLCWLRSSLSKQVKGRGTTASSSTLQQHQHPSLSAAAVAAATGEEETEPAATGSSTPGAVKSSGGLLQWDWSDYNCCAAPNDIYDADVSDSMLCLPCDHEVDFSPEIFTLTTAELVLSDSTTPTAVRKNRLIRGRIKLTQYAQLLGALQLPSVLTSSSLEESLQAAVNCNQLLLEGSGYCDSEGGSPLPQTTSGPSSSSSSSATTVTNNSSDARYAILLKIITSLDRLFGARLFFMRWWTRERIPNLLRDALPPRAQALERGRLLGLGKPFGLGAVQDNALLFCAATNGWPRFTPPSSVLQIGEGRERGERRSDDRGSDIDGRTVGGSTTASTLTIRFPNADIDGYPLYNTKLPFKQFNWGQCDLLSVLTRGNDAPPQGGGRVGSHSSSPMTTNPTPEEGDEGDCGLRVSAAALAQRVAAILNVFASSTEILEQRSVSAGTQWAAPSSTSASPLPYLSPFYVGARTVPGTSLTTIDSIHSIEDLALATIYRFGRPRRPIIQAILKTSKQRAPYNRQQQQQPQYQQPHHQYSIDPPVSPHSYSGSSLSSSSATTAAADIASGGVGGKHSPAVLVRETLRQYVRTVGQFNRPPPPSVAVSSTLTSATNSPDSGSGGSTLARAPALGTGAGIASYSSSSSSSSSSSAAPPPPAPAVVVRPAAVIKHPIPDYLAKSNAYWDEVVTGAFCEAIYLKLDSMEGDGSATAGGADAGARGKGGGTAGGKKKRGGGGGGGGGGDDGDDDQEDEGLEGELEISHLKWRPLTYQEVQALVAAAKKLLTVSASAGGSSVSESSAAAAAAAAAAATAAAAAVASATDSGEHGEAVFTVGGRTKKKRKSTEMTVLTSSPTDLRKAIARMDTVRLLAYLINSVDESSSSSSLSSSTTSHGGGTGSGAASVSGGGGGGGGGSGGWGGDTTTDSLSQSLSSRAGAGGVRRGKLGATVEEAVLCLHNMCVTQGGLPEWWGPSHTISLVKHITADGWGTWTSFKASYLRHTPTAAVIPELSDEVIEHTAEVLLDNAVSALFAVQGWSPPTVPRKRYDGTGRTLVEEPKPEPAKDGGTIREFPPAWLLCAFVAMYDRLPTLSEADVKRLDQLKSEHSRKL